MRGWFRSRKLEQSRRDELAKVIVAAYGEDAETECPCEQDLDVADAILAAGYRRPRTITTMEELDALPVESVVRTDNGEVFERQPEGPYCDGPHDWQSIEGTFWNGETFCFPVTVLHEGGAE